MSEDTQSPKQVGNLVQERLKSLKDSVENISSNVPNPSSEPKPFVTKGKVISDLQSKLNIPLGFSGTMPPMKELKKRKTAPEILNSPGGNVNSPISLNAKQTKEPEKEKQVESEKQTEKKTEKKEEKKKEEDDDLEPDAKRLKHWTLQRPKKNTTKKPSRRLFIEDEVKPEDTGQSLPELQANAIKSLESFFSATVVIDWESSKVRKILDFLYFKYYSLNCILSR